MHPQARDDEAQRLEVLESYQILDTPNDKRFQELVELASMLFQTSYAAITFIDQDRCWMKASVGFECQEIARGQSICARMFNGGEPQFIPLLPEDARFSTKPGVNTAPFLKSYLGAPLTSPFGCGLGVFAVCWTELRDVAPRDFKAIGYLADLVMFELERDQMLRDEELDSERRLEFLARIDKGVRVPLNKILSLFSEIKQKTSDPSTTELAEAGISATSELLAIARSSLDARGL